MRSRCVVLSSFVLVLLLFTAVVGVSSAATFKFKITDATPGSPTTSSDGAKPLKIKIKNAKGKLVKTLTVAGLPVNTNQTISYKWTKCTLAKGSYKFYVYAYDQAGNAQTKVTGAKLTVK